ncbi:MAG: hypothetical protein D6680_17545 [Cyanobacteria bacterium J007]|nr:MAG: hypothetical protein D6680_17545 [Cyanobacteria bacterium J007]
MNQPNDPDRRLVQFLREYAPDVPPPSPELEDRTIDALDDPHPIAVNRAKLRQLRPLWLVPVGIAAGLVVVWNGTRSPIPPQPSAEELAQLETYMETTWDGVLGETSLTESSDWFFPEASE